MNKEERLFFIIKKLLEKPYSVIELKNSIEQNFNFLPQEKEIYKDISKLKKVGFQFSEIPRKKGIGAKFKIEKTPFTYLLKEPEKELIEDMFATYRNNEYVITGLFDNIGSLLNFDVDEIIKEKTIITNNKKYLEIKKIVKRACLEKKKISFLYYPLNGEPKVSSGFPCNFETDDKKVDRFCLYMPDNPEEYRYIDYNLERIQEIPTILNEVMQGDFIPIFARFKLYHPTSISYHLLKDDVVESRDEENKTIIIRAKYYTSFRLVQKLLKYGETVEILHPPLARKMMKEKIMKMQKIYSD